MKYNNQILFGKYEVLKSLGSGSFSTVLLVRHLSLEQYRAIKIIPKQSGEIELDLFEAKLLTSFKHPGIPQIFDIEQDECNTYIVEEYLDGETLSDFLFRHNHISPKIFFKFCEQLCDIFIYLHRDAPAPIIYRDLKPEHIIVCQDQLKLIDFGISSYVSKKGNNFNYLGNVDFSAPECFTDATIGVSADIYSLGKIIEFISNYLVHPTAPNIHSLSQKATQEEPAARYETVEQLAQDLQTIKENYSYAHSRKTIAVVSSHRGCGCTHLSVAITCALNSAGYDAIYLEKNQHSSLQGSSELLGFLREKGGVMHYRNFCGLPQYGPGVLVHAPTDTSISVCDYGVNYTYEDLCEADLVLFIVSPAFWHANELYSILYDKTAPIKTTKFVCNRCEKEVSLRLANLMKRKVYTLPYIRNPLSPDKSETNKLIRLIDEEGGVLSFLRKRKSLLPRRF